MQPFFGPPFSSMPMQAPMQGMSQAANMMQGAGPTNAMAGLGSQAARGGGGFLSRILGGLGGLGGGSNAASAPMMGGLSQAAGAGGMNFTTMLTNAQKVLGLGQQVLPMVQQYGPLIRNAPALLKLMRSSDSNSDTTVSPEAQMSTQVPISDENSESHSSSAPTHEQTQYNQLQSDRQHTQHYEIQANKDQTQPFSLEEKPIKRKKNPTLSPTLIKPKTIDGIPAPKLYV